MGCKPAVVITISTTSVPYPYTDVVLTTERRHLPKLTIYVPERLNEQLRAMELNVSAVCQRALEEEVRRMNARAQATSEIEAVAARLRSTIGEDEEHEYEQGFEVGSAWARNTATLSELRDVADLRGEFWYQWTPGEEHSLMQYLGEAVGGRWHGLEDDSFAAGVIAGAGEVYDKVEPLLRDGDDA